jgi:ribonuclease G
MSASSASPCSQDDKVAEVYLERPERRSIAGNIYLSQVDNVLPGMEAAFVEIGLEKNGFLYVDEIVGPELERAAAARSGSDQRGQTILVQAVKDDEDEGRAADDPDLAARPLRRLRPAGRRPRRLAQARRRRAPAAEGDPQEARREGRRPHRAHRGRVRPRRTSSATSSSPPAALEVDPGEGREARPELIYQEAERRCASRATSSRATSRRRTSTTTRPSSASPGYLKKTSPHMVERVIRYRETVPLMEAFGVDQEIKSTLHRRVDLPSGGYLTRLREAFTVIDVNTGRFVGSRGKNSRARLEDTITKNNLEAVKEVVRQLRLRDIGGSSSLTSSTWRTRRTASRSRRRCAPSSSATGRRRTSSRSRRSASSR